MENGVYSVELLESDWYGSGIDRAALIAQFKDTAIVAAAKWLVIFVTPDPLFSLCGESKRHKVHEYRFPEDAKPYKVSAMFSAEINPDVYSKASEGEQRKLVRKLRDELNEYAVSSGVAGRYAILVGGKQVEAGRV